MNCLFQESSGCLFAQIAWLWYAIAVITVFMFGWLWYGVLFKKSWLKAVQYQCNCGAQLSNGEKCNCQHSFTRDMLPMIMQLVSTMLLGLLFFGLVKVSIPLAIFTAIAISGWMKASLKFQTPNWKRFFSLAIINVGYFFLSCMIFILFALI